MLSSCTIQLLFILTAVQVCVCGAFVLCACFFFLLSFLSVAHHQRTVIAVSGSRPSLTVTTLTAHAYVCVYISHTCWYAGWSWDFEYFRISRLWWLLRQKGCVHDSKCIHKCMHRMHMYIYIGMYGYIHVHTHIDGPVRGNNNSQKDTYTICTVTTK